MRDSKENIIFFKVRFFSDKTYYGFFYFIIDPFKEAILQFNTLASKFTLFLSQHFTMEYISNCTLLDVEMKIRKIKDMNEYHISTTSRIFSKINIYLKENPEEALDIIRYIIQKKDLDISYKLQYLFKKILNVKDIDFEYVFDGIPYEDITDFSGKIQNKEDEDFKKDLNKFQMKILHLEESYARNFHIRSATFIISPYSWVSVRNLKSGDAVSIYLAEEMYTSNSQNYENPEEEVYDKTKTVVGIVDKVFSGPMKQFYFMIQIDSYTYARILEMENFNVKMASKEKEELLNKSLFEDNLKRNVNEKSFKMQLLFSIIGIIFIIMLLYLLYY